MVSMDRHTADIWHDLKKMLYSFNFWKPSQQPTWNDHQNSFSLKDGWCLYRPSSNFHLLLSSILPLALGPCGICFHLFLVLDCWMSCSSRFPVLSWEALVVIGRWPFLAMATVEISPGLVWWNSWVSCLHITSIASPAALEKLGDCWIQNLSFSKEKKVWWTFCLGCSRTSKAQ